MTRFKQYFLKWNWGGFLFMLILSAIGLLTNKTVDTMYEWGMGVLVVGLPLSLGFAWMTKED